MGDCAHRALKMRRSVFADEAGGLITYVFAAMADAPATENSTWPYVAKGGSAAQPSMQCESKTCIECGGGLFIRDKREATVYGFHRSARVTHVVKACGKRECATRHWHNYRTRRQSKIYFATRKMRDVLFVNSAVGFDVVFLRYAQQLHFIGYVSIAAIAKCHSEVFGAPLTTRFRSYLSDAMFLLHAVTEFSAIGIDANTIRIGDEVTQDAIEKYSAFLARYVFPPKHLLGVRAVVADGNAKVLTKCCRGVTAPKRAGAPRKGRAGEKRGAKHYWDGRFFSQCPKTGRIPQTSPMYHPENNDFVLGELERW